MDGTVQNLRDSRWAIPVGAVLYNDPSSSCRVHAWCIHCSLMAHPGGGVSAKVPLHALILQRHAPHGAIVLHGWHDGTALQLRDG